MLQNVGKFVVTTSLFLAFGYSNVAWCQDTAKSTKVDVHIGIYAPFSNESAFLGRNILAAVEMGRDTLKTSEINYTFYTLDQLPESAKVTDTLEQFIKAHHIDVLLTEGSANGLLIAPVAKKNNIIHFSMASEPTIADGNNNFLAWSPAKEQAAVLVNELKHKKINSIGIINADNPSANALTQSVIKQIQNQSSIKIASHNQITAKKDFAVLINKVKDQNPDLYFIMASPDDIELIQNKMREAHIDKPVTSIVDRVDSKVMKVFQGQWYIDTHDMKPEFVNQFKATYTNYPVTEAGYAYDVFSLVNQGLTMALKNQSQLSTQVLAQQIHALASGNGVMGPYHIDDKGVLYTKSEVKVIKNGHVMTV